MAFSINNFKVGKKNGKRIMTRDEFDEQEGGNPTGRLWPEKQINQNVISENPERVYVDQVLTSEVKTSIKDEFRSFLKSNF